MSPNNDNFKQLFDNSASRKLIVDNDSGVDDAWALFIVAKSSVKNEILGITCVNGNTSLENVCRNNLYFLTVINRPDIPVFKGANSPLIPPETNSIKEELKHFHGKNGFGDVPLPEKNMPKVQKENAISALHRITSEQKGLVTLFCCGPLTNIALAIKTYPDFASNVKDVFIMGGNYQATGNTTRSAEFNFHSDPEAAYIVLEEMKGKIVLLPWETCLNLRIPLAWRNELAQKSGPMVTFLNQIERPIMNRAQSLGFQNYVSADQVLAAVLTDPSMIDKYQEINATIELSGQYTRGQVVIDHLHTRQPNVLLIKQLNVSSYKSFLSSYKHY